MQDHTKSKKGHKWARNATRNLSRNYDVFLNAIFLRENFLFAMKKICLFHLRKFFFLRSIFFCSVRNTFFLFAFDSTSRSTTTSKLLLGPLSISVHRPIPFVSESSLPFTFVNGVKESDSTWTVKLDFSRLFTFLFTFPVLPDSRVVGFNSSKKKIN